MNWFLAYASFFVLGLTFLILLRRRGGLREYAQSHYELADAKERGSHKARLQHPNIDLAKCIGCGTCVKACPEDGVLSLLHGQAVVVHGARCVGHGLCAAACPTGAITLTLGDLSDRRDLPDLEEDLEVVGVPGLFLTGELGGFALVRTAVTLGIAVADAVAKRVQDSQNNPTHKNAVSDTSSASDAGPDGNDLVDLLIIGAGQSRFLELSQDCSSCHEDPHTGQFLVAERTDCARRHSDDVKGFVADLFDHQRDSRLALDEHHHSLDCSACHKPVALPTGDKIIRYTPLGIACTDCHDTRRLKEFETQGREDL